MKRNIGVLGLAVAVLAAAGCGGKTAPVAIKTQMAEDKAGGFKIAIPEGWERETLKLSDPRRRWFAAKWKPANVEIPPEALFVHLMAPGCAASELGGKYAGKPFASDPKPEGFSVVASAPGVVGNRQAFRIDGKYRCALGEIFEASVYLETGPGIGYFVTSRGAASDEEATKARLEAALVGFEVEKREIRVEKSSAHTGGITVGFPAGFDEYSGPAAFGTASYAVGAIDVQQRQETISLVLAPPVANGEAFLNARLSDASRGLTKSGSRQIKIGDQSVSVSSFTPAEGAPRYEIAVVLFKLGHTPAAILAQACMFPPGRSLDLLEETAGTVSCRAPNPTAVTRPFLGEGGLRATLCPEGWESKTANAEIASTLAVMVPGAEGGEPKRQEVELVEATVEEDYVGNGTPREAVNVLAQRFDPAKTRLVLVDEFVLKDGRKAARATIATPISYEFFMVTRATAGALVRVHVSALPPVAEDALAVGMEMLAATHIVPLADQPAPAASVLEATRKELPSLLQRARSRPAGDAWYLEETGGKDFGGQKLSVGVNGAWTDRERRPSTGSSIESSMTASPGTYQELVIFSTVVAGPGPQMGPPARRTETRIDAADEHEVSVSRLRSGGEAHNARFPKPDLYVPPDVAASDGLIVALAGSPEGTYAFTSVSERLLTLRWREFRVKGEESVEVPAGKFKARRIEVGAKSVYWVAEGRIVKADTGEFVRKLAGEAAVKKYLPE